MTKEEARKRLLDWIQYVTDPEKVPFMDEPCSDEEILLAMRIGADALSQPSLPFNIDEVADKQAETIYPKIIREGHIAKHDVNLLTRRGFKKGFKAGAG